ncbi:MAG: glycosyltransferase family 2 protein [Gemmatimonadetes bacterium]|nr:glycosyltransferase family 2 protein [Gemmatimonadota bacterium]
MAERVAICVATYRRPVGLERLLLSLNGLRFARTEPAEIEVIVVDNDPGRSAAAVCAAIAPWLRWALRYEHEPRRGVSQARNRALACAMEHADWISFLDDDEEASPHWLDELLYVQATYEADAVAGPVLPRFEERPPAWVAKGHFFDLPRYPTGARMRDCGSGNVLLRTEALRAMPRFFDDRLGLVGGEDTEFFVRFVHTGFSLVWADEALAHEWVPPSRVSARWILQREYRTSLTWSLCERILHPAPAARVGRVAKGFVRIAQGALLLPTALQGRHALVRALRYMARGMGHVAGVAGLEFQEYRVVHGR